MLSKKSPSHLMFAMLTFLEVDFYETSRITQKMSNFLCNEKGDVNLFTSPFLGDRKKCSERKNWANTKGSLWCLGTRRRTTSEYVVLYSFRFNNRNSRFPLLLLYKIEKYFSILRGETASNVRNGTPDIANNL